MKKAECTWTKHSVLPSHQNKTPAQFHGMSDMEHSDKKIEHNKGTNSQLIFSWTPPGQLRKKNTELKSSQNSEHPGFFFAQNQVATATTWKKQK